MDVGVFGAQMHMQVGGQGIQDALGGMVGGAKGDVRSASQHGQEVDQGALPAFLQARQDDCMSYSADLTDIDRHHFVEVS
jgi:hypothetical protein